MGASWQMRGLARLMRVVYHRRFATEAAGHARLLKEKGSAEPPAALTSRRAVDRYEVDGFPVVVVSPRAGSPRHTDRVVVQVHGGAYTAEIVAQHWQLAAHLADRSGADVHVALYGLAPAHHADEALAFVGAVVARLTAAGRQVHLVGDSSGGGLALLVAQHADEATRRGLVGLTALAPWLDMAMANPDVPAVERVDPWLSRAGLRPIADAWVDGTPLDDPRVSPLHGDLTGLPPVAIWVGSRDITVPDCRLLRDRLADQPGFRYVELEGGLHVYPLLPVPEGRRDRDALTTHVAHSFAAPRVA